MLKKFFKKRNKQQKKDLRTHTREQVKLQVPQEKIKQGRAAEFKLKYSEIMGAEQKVIQIIL